MAKRDFKSKLTGVKRVGMLRRKWINIGRAVPRYRRVIVEQAEKIVCNRGA